MSLLNTLKTEKENWVKIENYKSQHQKTEKNDRKKWKKKREREEYAS